MTYTPEKRREYEREYRKNNKALIAQIQHNYYVRNKTAILEQDHKYYKEHRADRLQYKHEYDERNREKISQREREYRIHNRPKIRVYRRVARVQYERKRRIALMDILGGPFCHCSGINCWHDRPCGISYYSVLQLEHINGNGSKDKKRFKKVRDMINYYLLHPDEARENLQVYCSNCNWAKRVHRLEYSIIRKEEITESELCNSLPLLS